ncbi:MFS transporter [Sphingobium lignivorans]|uniref:MFS family permease n=1 Tax=Sphingobium lignivorans TaxID=2735886 RepID=A0ABR6NIJ7_9SPHN|nr:MFS transporter [Sphingobium lignivorans]MBB5987115.1 MFS family permease [Sphingobium lignivorans]
MTNDAITPRDASGSQAPSARTHLTEPQNDLLYRRVLWRIMPLLVICYIVAFIDRSNVGIAKIQFMGDLGFTNAQYGFGAGIFYLGYVLLEIPSNQWLARIGARITILRIMIFWGICCTLMAWMSTAPHFYALRFLLGAAEAGFFPGVLLYLTYWIPARRRARFNAIFLAAIPVAGMLGGPLAGLIMSGMDGVWGWRGWQWLFVLEGLPAILLGLVAYGVLDDKPSDCRWLAEHERAQIMADVSADARKLGDRAHATFGAVLADPAFYALGLLGFGIMVSTGGIFFWLPTIIDKSGVENLRDVGLLSALPFIIAVFFQYFIARRSDRLQERRWHTLIPALVGAVGWSLLPFVAQNTSLALIALAVATSGTFSAMGPFWSLPSTMLSGRAMAGGIALVTTLAGLGNFLSPILVGWLVDRTGSLAAGQFYFAGLLALGTAGVLVSQRRFSSGTD